MLGDTHNELHCGVCAHNCQCTRLHSACGPFYKQKICDESHWGMQVGTPQKKKCSLTEVSVVRRFTSTFHSLHYIFTTTSCVFSHSLKAPRDESSPSLSCSASSERLCQNRAHWDRLWSLSFWRKLKLIFAGGSKLKYECTVFWRS